MTQYFLHAQKLKYYYPLYFLAGKMYTYRLCKINLLLFVSWAIPNCPWFTGLDSRPHPVRISHDTESDLHWSRFGVWDGG